MTDIYEIAKEVEEGKWGTTAAEKKASLAEAGYDYAEIKKCMKELKTTGIQKATVENSDDTDIVEEPAVIESSEQEVVVEKAEPVVEDTKYLKYVVRRGDSIDSIAYRFNINPRVLAFINGLTINSRLAVGQTIKIINK